MVLESHVKLGMTELDFPGRFFCPQNWENGPKLGLKQVFFNLLENWFINLTYNENLYYLLCFCTNPIFGKIFVPEIWARMFSANQIAGFFNQPYLQKKSVKQPDFLHVGTNSHKLKVDQNILGWLWSEMIMASLITGLQNLKSELMNELIFCMLVQSQES